MVSVYLLICYVMATATAMMEVMNSIVVSQLIVYLLLQKFQIIIVSYYLNYFSFTTKHIYNISLLDNLQFFEIMLWTVSVFEIDSYFK